MGEGELWHLVEARRDDGAPTMFRIRELEPRPELTKIFVVKIPYPITEMSSLPDAAAYRRLSLFEEQWLAPACRTLGWELVASKSEDGSFYLYMYGATDSNGLITWLSPFDAALGFYDDDDPQWTEYATLRELLEQAKALPDRPEDVATKPPRRRPSPTSAQRPPITAKPRPKPKAKPNVRAKAKPKGKAKAKSTAKFKSKPRSR